MKLKIDVSSMLLPEIKTYIRQLSLRYKLSPEDRALVRDFLTLYRERFGEINNIVIQDLAGGISVTLSSHTLDSTSCEKLKKFLEEVTRMNINKLVNQELINM